MNVTLTQLFSIIDGRLATSVEDATSIMNYLLGRQLLTHELPNALDFINNFCTTYQVGWYNEAASAIDAIKLQNPGDDFETLAAGTKAYSIVFNIKPLSEYGN